MTTADASQPKQEEAISTCPQPSESVATSSDGNSRQMLPIPPEVVKQRVEAWLDLMESTDQIYIAALRARCANEEEVWKQYKAAWDYYNREHERTLERMLIRLGDGGASHVG